MLNGHFSASVPLCISQLYKQDLSRWPNLYFIVVEWVDISTWKYFTVHLLWQVYNMCVMMVKLWCLVALLRKFAEAGIIFAIIITRRGRYNVAVLIHHTYPDPYPSQPSPQVNPFNSLLMSITPHPSTCHLRRLN